MFELRSELDDILCKCYPISVNEIRCRCFKSRNIVNVFYGMAIEKKQLHKQINTEAMTQITLPPQGAKQLLSLLQRWKAISRKIGRYHTAYKQEFRSVWEVGDSHRLKRLTAVLDKDTKRLHKLIPLPVCIRYVVAIQRWWRCKVYAPGGALAPTSFSRMSL